MLDAVTGNFIVLVLILFPAFAGLFLLIRFALGRNSVGPPQQVWPPRKRRKKRFLPWLSRSARRTLFIAGALAILALAQALHKGTASVSTRNAGQADGNVASENITCDSPSITDGDTLRCDGQRIRLYGIDTPEMPGHCRPGRTCTEGDPYAAKDHLESLSRGPVTCEPIEKDHYGRTVARCTSAGKDLSCEMVSSSHAVRRYGTLTCF